MSAEDLRFISLRVRAWMGDRRAVSTPFDVVIEGETKTESQGEWNSIVSPWIEAGATWWLESMWGYTRQKNAEDLILERVQLGPPSKNISSARIEMRAHFRSI